MQGVFIFRRDFRIVDNIPLIESLKKCSKVIPIFIFDPYQLDIKNSYHVSVNSVQFMLESLEDLNKQLNNSLHFFYGDPVKVLQKLKKVSNFDLLSFNLDYSPYSQTRDSKIIEFAKKNGITLEIYEHDNVLVDYNKVLANSGDPYTVFSSYYKSALKQKVNKVIKTTKKNFLSSKLKGEVKLSDIKKKLIKTPNKDLIKGGRTEALKILKNIKDWRDYNSKRDDLSYDTTHLSGYLKFGCVSIREVYWEFKNDLQKNNDLIKQLYWRSHYFVLARYSNSEYRFKHIEDRFKNIKWSNKFGEKMWYGETGFPVIDAGVRELNATGFMHNRARLLVANFSIKVLHIDPFGKKWSGQEYFSRTLIDCCYANNYGNWLWILGPYDPSGYRFGKKNTFSGRVFKDIINFSKWDKDLSYVRKWIPELKDVPDKDVKRWNTAYKKYPDIKYKPIVDFEDQIKKWYKLTKN